MVPVNYDVIVALFQTGADIAGQLALSLLCMGSGALQATAAAAHAGLISALP